MNCLRINLPHNHGYQAPILCLLLVWLLSTSCTYEAASRIPQSGSVGIGDPYFPQVGNGGYDAQHYTLNLIVDVTQNSLTGTATIQALATHSLISYNLDLAGFTIDTVQVNGKPAVYSRDGRELTIVPATPLLHGTHFTTTITYRGVPGAGVAGEAAALGIGWQPYDGGIVVTSEPTGASGW